MKRENKENKVWVIYGTMFLIAWIWSNVLTWGTASIIPFIVIFGGYVGGLCIVFIQFHFAVKDLYKDI